jgi:RNA polymerase sigma-70 factor (ECF subfamily)
MATVEDEVTRVFEDAREDVYRYLLTLGLDPGRAQEATQEVFLRLYQVLRRGAEIQNLRAWVFRVAHNLGLDWRARERSLPLEPGLEAILSDGRPRIDAAMIQDERMTQIGEAWKVLSPQQRQCLHLRAEGLRYREIAEAMGISISTVREFLSRAIARLQKAVL